MSSAAWIAVGVWAAALAFAAAVFYPRRHPRLRRVTVSTVWPCPVCDGQILSWQSGDPKDERVLVGFVSADLEERVEAHEWERHGIASGDPLRASIQRSRNLTLH
jgi:hypothetical protein